MTVKIIKRRSLVAPLPGISNVKEDGYFRYVTVNGQRVGNVYHFRDGTWQFCEAGTRYTVSARTQRDLLVQLRKYYV